MISSLPLFLLLACGLTGCCIAAEKPRLLGRMPVTAFTLIWLLLWLPLRSLPNGAKALWAAELLLAAAVVVGLMAKSGTSFRFARLKQHWPALTAVILITVLFSWRWSLLEYPIDHVEYWQRLTQANVNGSQPFGRCLVNTIAAYSYPCVLWHRLAILAPSPLQDLISGAYVRVVHGLEILLFGLALVRLWARANLRPLAMALWVPLVAFGTGYLYDSFLINHALQGSIIGAVLFVEGADIFLWFYQRMADQSCGHSRRRQAALVAAMLAFGMAETLLQLRFHGVFALLTLIWLLIVPLLVGIGACRGRSPWGIPAAAGWMLILASLGTTLLLSIQQGLVVQVPQNFAGVVIRWSALPLLHWLPEQGPVSFLPRTSDTRPEALAVLGVCAASWTLLTFRRQGSAKDSDSFYAYGSALFVVGIVLAYILPPFSNLLLQINTEWSSHMRLMWGICLFSPLPFWLPVQSGPRQPADGRPPGLERNPAWRSIRAGLSLIIVLIILVPIQLAPGARRQLFFSKSRHVFTATPAWADPQVIARELLPLLLAQTRNLPEAQAGTAILADPLITSALRPFAQRLGPASLRPQPLDRIDHGDELKEPLLDPLLQPAPIHLNPRPAYVIQQPNRHCFYSAYADMAAYEDCIAARVTDLPINHWSPAQMRQAGFGLVARSRDLQIRVWRLEARTLP